MRRERKMKRCRRNQTLGCCSRLGRPRRRRNSGGLRLLLFDSDLCQGRKKLVSGSLCYGKKKKKNHPTREGWWEEGEKTRGERLQNLR